MKKSYSYSLLCMLLALLGTNLAAQNCVTTQTISQGSNVYSQLQPTINPIAVDPDLNTIVYIHRQNAAQFPGTSSFLRYDMSTDGGTTWSSNQGPLNPISASPARYPQAAIYNPPGNTNPSMAYLAYQAPTLNTNWDGVVTGVRRLDNTNGTETYNQAASTNTFWPKGIMEGAPGVFWSVDAIFDGSNYSGLRVYKGTWTNGNVNWVTSSTLTPNFNTTFGTPRLSEYSMAWDPSGQFGWIGFITDLTSGPNLGTLHPAFYRTEDGGQTWSGPEAVDLNSFSCITNQFPPNTLVGSAFELNLTVDINGNVHALVEAAEASTTTTYSIVLTPNTFMFDLTYDAGTYTAIPLGSRNTFRGALGTFNSVNMDGNLQCSRSPDGTKTFFFWTDSNPAIHGNNNDAPDLFGASYDVVSQKKTAFFNFTSCSSTHAQVAWFPQMSAIALPTSSSRWIVPTTLVELGPSADALQTADFVYVGNVYFDSTDYVTPVCTNNAFISNNGSLCAGGVTLTTSAAGDGYLWSNGATTQSISVTQPGTYHVTVSSRCCLSGSDSIVVSGTAPVVAGFSQTGSGLAFGFTDTSSSLPTAWFWDFGDGTTSTLPNPNHTYATAGTYSVCLTVTNACNTDSMCALVLATCAAPTVGFTQTNGSLTVGFTDTTTVQAPASFAWSFGDGSGSTLQNPQHIYTTPGIYTVCLTVNDFCGSSTTCLPVNVSCPAPTALWQSSNLGGMVSFLNQSSNTSTSWSWTFGDGGTSTLQNPTHTYVANGSYSVCLVTTSPCGSDTFCDAVNVVVVGMENPASNQLEVFPNPGNGPLAVQATFASAGFLNLSLLDLRGVEVAILYEDWAEPQFKKVFDLTEFPAGVYFLKYSIRDKTGLVKVLRH